jgi:cell division protein FtsN
MSDYRNSDFNYRNANDPVRPNQPYDPDARAMNATWGWIAAAVFLVVVLAVAFGVGHQPGQINTASNDTAPSSAATRMAPPLTAAPPANNAAPNNAAPMTPVPVLPTPNSPAQGSSQ